MGPLVGRLLRQASQGDLCRAKRADKLHVGLVVDGQGDDTSILGAVFHQHELHRAGASVHDVIHDEGFHHGIVRTLSSIRAPPSGAWPAVTRARRSRARRRSEAGS